MEFNSGFKGLMNAVHEVRTAALHDKPALSNFRKFILGFMEVRTELHSSDEF